MIPHSYLNPSDNLAQYRADECGRQEVTAEWYLEHMCDAPLFAWTCDEDLEMGLDPWRLLSMTPDRPRRLFVQLRDMSNDHKRDALIARVHNELGRHLGRKPTTDWAAMRIVQICRPELWR